ncbi:3-hydroxyacyl-CoA dehydrogenase NAD-binding domain-containing protein [Alteromonas sp. H39]|uniref:3-hydroxyacyl-CoA dehydrogenase NAD-binding domain-containing protein n=1 Tax=Alteromonas sp. H39 TaxID=3389876 RepID=UPI0039E14B39
MCDVVKLEREDDIAIITINNPPVNALSGRVRRELKDAFLAFQKDKKLLAAVLHGEHSAFSAGVDIHEFCKPTDAPSLPELLAIIDDIEKPVVAAIEGNALGGGLELALTCHYRIAHSHAQLGCPEVKLGILPGAGGTQRLPRLIGAEAALNMITSAQFSSAREGGLSGLIDRVVDENLLDNAKEYARHLLRTHSPIRRLSERKVNTAVLNKDFFEDYRDKLAAAAPGFNAPLAAVNAVEAATKGKFAKGISFERSLFNECLQSDQSRAQRYVFFAQRRAPRVDLLAAETTPITVHTVGVVGAGKMGQGITTSCLLAGYPVTLVDLNQHALDTARAAIEQSLTSLLRRHKLTHKQRDAAFARLSTSQQLSHVSGTDLVIEAIQEDRDAKRRLFTELLNLLSSNAVIATNTSTLDINALAEGLKSPGQLVGMHFFSPAHLMQLVEVVQGDATRPAAVATAMAMARSLKKVAVLSGGSDSLIGNRMLSVYSREADALLLEGAGVVQTDDAMRRFGMAMGPFQMADLIGLEAGYHARKSRQQRGADNLPVTSPVADKLVEAERVGQGTEAGYYRYEQSCRAPIPDPAVDKIIDTTAADLSISRVPIDDDTIVRRLTLRLINEACKIIDEGIVQRPSDIDVIWVNGYGFPIFRGGPLCYADSLGLDNVVAELNALEKSSGPRWKPSAYLIQAMAARMPLASYDTLSAGERTGKRRA